jgi:threonine/homoserine/homoserine lactone efflux protein
MSAAVFASLVAFSIAMSITPGPNNLLLTTSGLTYGFRRTLPAMAGTLIGVGLLFAIAGAGVGALIMAEPRAQSGLRVFGAGYLVYLAWRLWRAGEVREAEGKPPLGVWHVAAFQFVNPKAWMMTVSTVSIYAAPAADYAFTLIMVTLTFLIVSTPSIALWAGFGAGMKAVLKDTRRLKLFNRGMAALTIASAVFVLLWT